MPKATGVEVARISVKVSPDTSKFYEDLKRKLKAIERALGKDGVEAGDLDVGTEKAEKKVAKSSKKMSKNLGALTDEAKKASRAVSKIKIGDISKDISSNIGALDKYAGKFDVKNGLFWDPKEGKEATQLAIDGYKALKEQSDKLAAAESKRIKDITTKTKKLVEVSNKSKTASKFDISTSKFKIKPTADIGKSIESMERASGKIALWDDKEAARLEAEIDKSVPKIQKKLDMLDLRWDKKMRDFKLAPTLRKELTEGLAEAERLEDEMLLVTQAAKKAGSDIYRVFNAADNKTMRSALRDYALGFRDIGFEAQKARTITERTMAAFGKTSGIQTGRDQLRARGGLTGALLGGVAGITALKAGLELTKGIGKSISKLPGMFGDAGSAAGGFFGKMKDGVGKLSGLVPSFGTGMNFAAYGVIIAGITLLAAPLIGLISSALLTLPGLLALVLTPIAAITLGLDGLKEAAKVLEEPFNQLKATMSAKVKDQFAPVFEQLKKIFPSLEATLPSVSKGMADIAQSVVDFATEGVGKTQIEETITGLGARLTEMAPGVRDFTAAMVGLAHEFVTGGALEGVGEWFTDTMADFREWVNTEDLTGMFEGLGASLKIVMDTLGEMAQSGLDFISNPESMDGFLDTLDSVGDLLEGILNVSEALGDVWDGIAAPFTNFGEGLDKAADWLRGDGGFGGFGGGEGGWFDSWLPEDWTETVSEEAATAGRAAKRAFNNGLKEVQDAAFDQGILEGTGIDVNNLTAPVQEGVQEIAATIAAAGAEGKEALQNALSADDVSTGVATQVQGQVAAAVSGALVAVDPLIANLQGKIDLALQPLSLVASRVGEVFTEASGAIDGALGTSLDNVAGKFETTSSRITTALSNISVATAQDGASALQSLATDAQTAMTTMDTAVTTGSDSVVATLTGLPGRMSGAMGDVGGTLAPAGAALMSGLSSGIESGFQIILDRVRAMAGEIAAEKGPLPYDKTVLIPNGEALMQGLGKGMEDGFAPVLDQAKGLADRISDAFAQGNVDPTQILKGMSNKDINRVEKTLGTQMKILDGQIQGMTYRNRGNKDPAVQAELDKLKTMKEELGMQKQMIDLAQDYAGIDDKSGGGEDPFVKAASGLMNSPADFAKATGKQFMSDLGIGGDGMIGNAITEGISYIFNIASVDDALSVKDREDSKAALPGVGR